MMTTATACGPGQVGDALRPGDTTAHQALGEGPCRAVAEHADPLIVDWKPEQRGDLEVGMAEGVAVVAYSCNAIRVLKDCHVDGKYGFIGITSKEQLVRLENSDELHANLPAGVASLGVEVSTAVQRGATLDIAMVMIGKKRSIRLRATKAELVGDCAGATHFVRGATVGAFAVDTGTQGEARAVADVFGAKAAGKSASKKFQHVTDGSLDACRTAQIGAPTPPNQCGALIRLELTALDTKATTDGAATSECAAGLVRSGGKCTAAAVAHQCQWGNQAECSEQCEKGNAESCAFLAEVLKSAPAAGRDLARAFTVADGACTKGSLRGCFLLGAMFAYGWGTKRDLSRSNDLFRRACDGGFLTGCINLGVHLDRGAGITRDKPQALALYQRACAGGLALGCNNVGSLYAAGEAGLAKDPKKAFELFKQACTAGDALGCANQGSAYLTARGVEKDDTQVFALYQRSFTLNPWVGARYVGDAYRNSWGAAKDEAKAAAYYKQGCDALDAEACTSLATAYSEGRGVPKDLAKSNELLASACEGASVAGCATLGWRLLTGTSVPAKDEARARRLFQDGCELGDEESCVSIGDMYEKGVGAAQDLQKALTLYRESCNRGGGRACFRVAYMLNDTTPAVAGVAKNQAESDRLALVSCDYGYGQGCNLVGLAADRAHDPKAARIYYTRSCETGFAFACVQLGVVVLRGDADSPANPARASVLFERGCDAGEGLGCHNLAVAYFYGTTRDPVRATALFARGCETTYGWADSCIEAAEAHLDGRGVPRDAARGAAFFKRACELGSTKQCASVAPREKVTSKYFAETQKSCQASNPAACSVVADLFLEGRGVPKDRKRAVDAYRKGCAGNNPYSCKRLVELNEKP